MICPHCAAKIPDDSNFCPKCAKKVVKVCNCWVKEEPFDCEHETCPGLDLWRLLK